MPEGMSEVKMVDVKHMQPVMVRRSLAVLVMRLLIAPLIFGVIYIFWRIFIDINLFRLPADTLLAINSISIIIFFALIMVVQTAVVLIVVLDWVNRYYEIRSDELVVISGILTKKEVEYPYGNIQSITVVQGLVGRIFNYGSVRVYIPTLGHDLYFMEVPDPHRFVEMVKEFNPQMEGGKFLFRR
jgi:uncharacterized membrane protein YdbT with pleckstrin-like domain